MKRCFILVLILSLHTLCFSTPAPTGFNQSTGVVTGSGFGSKSTAPPTFFDDFEDGTLTGWSYNGAGSSYSASTSVTRTNSTYSMLKANNTPTDGGHISTTSQNTYYVSFWFYATSANILNNNKYFRAGSSTNSENIVMNSNSNSSALQMTIEFAEGGTEVDYGSQGISALQGAWTFIECVYELPVKSGSNNYARFYFNGVLKSEILNKWTTDELSNDPYIGFGYWFSTTYGIGSGWYFDDVYIDYSLARVIIGNASTYAASTQREMQIPSAWGTTEITTTVNVGAFAESATAYVYVLDSNGAVNSSGLEITVGSASTTPSVALSGSNTTVAVDTSVTIQGTATATAGRTITGIASPGLTVTCDDGTCDELEEAFSAESGTLNLDLNSYVFTATDSSAETGQATFNITYTPAVAECDADHFWLCETQTPCESAGHNWWESSCKTITEPTDWAGVNLITNGDFLNWTTGDPDSWNVNDSAKVFEDTYGCQVTNDGTISQLIPLEDGVTYRYVVDLVEIIEGQFEVYYYDTSVLYNTLETITATFTLGTVADHWMYFKAPTGSNEVVFNNIILKKIETGSAVTGSSGTATVGSTGTSSIGSAP